MPYNARRSAGTHLSVTPKREQLKEVYEEATLQLYDLMLCSFWGDALVVSPAHEYSAGALSPLGSQVRRIWAFQNTAINDRRTGQCSLRGGFLLLFSVFQELFSNRKGFLRDSLWYTRIVPCLNTSVNSTSYFRV